MLTLYASPRTTGRGHRAKSLTEASVSAVSRCRADRCVTNDVPCASSRRDRIPRSSCGPSALREATKHGRRLDLRSLSIFCSRCDGRAAELLRAPIDHARRSLTCQCAVDHWTGESRDVDLLIRTGGEQRLSDFLLWECAYAELYFTDAGGRFFTADLDHAVKAFHSRERGSHRSRSAAG